MGFRPELQNCAMEILTSAKARAKALKDEANEAARIEKILEDLHLFMINDWPLHIIDLLSRESAKLKAINTNMHTAIQFIEEVDLDAKEKADAIKRRYPTYLEQACQYAGLALDPESRHPTYHLEQQFFQLKVDEQKWIANISDHEGRLAVLPADVGAVVEVLQRERKRIFDRPFIGPKFLKRLHSQYMAIVKMNKLVIGTSIPIRQIIRRLEKNTKGFRSDEFLMDLSRLIEQGTMEIDGYRLDLQQTKDIKQGILLHGIAGRGYIGFILFRKV